MTDEIKNESTSNPLTTYQQLVTVTLWSSNLEDGIDLISAPLPGLISGEQLAMLKYIIDLWISSIFSYMGLLTNIIAIKVFAKMGFQETVNISLTCIAFWDTIKCLACALIRLYGPLGLISPALAETWYAFNLIIVGYIYTIASYVSGAVAGYVAIERCLCVSMPFTVKILLTRKVVTTVNVLVSIGVTGSYLCAFTLNSYHWVYSPKYNQTVAVIGHSSVRYDHPALYDYYQVMSLFYPIGTFLLMCVCTLIIIYHLRKASTTRSINTGDKSKKHEIRDRQVTVMLSVIIAVYIVSYIPLLCLYLIQATVKEFKLYGAYKNLFWLITYIMFTCGLLNAMANPIILYLMSSQFRQMLRDMFRLKKQK